MAIRRWWLFAASVVAVLALSGPQALGDTPLPAYSYGESSPGGAYVFVMIAPLPPEEDTEGWNEETASSIRRIRKTYAQSGLYRNEGSAEPLWTVDWYAHNVDVASDGVHLVRHGPWASSTHEEALSFFASGRLLRTCRIRELVDNPILLRRTASHFFWKKAGWFDDARLEYTLTTMDGNRFAFDVRTGEVVSAARPGRAVLLTILALAGTLALGALAWLVVRRRRQRRRAKTGAGRPTAGPDAGSTDCRR